MAGSPIEAAKAFVRVTLRDETDKGIADLRTKLKSLSKSFTEVGFQVVKVGSLITASFGSALAALTFPVTIASHIQDATVSFEALTGSARRATLIVQELRQFAARTPLEFEGLGRSVQGLLAYGRASDEVVDDVKALSAVARGNQATLERLALAYGQVATKTRLFATEVRQFTESGFSPLSAIAERTGESLAQVDARITAGGVSFGELRAALFATTKGYGRFASILEKRSKTLSGSFIRLRDGFKIAIEPIGKELVPVITTIINGFARFVSDIGPVIEANKELVNVFLLVAAGGTAAGLAITAFGFALLGIGSAIKVLEAITETGAKLRASFAKGAGTDKVTRELASATTAASELSSAIVTSTNTAKLSVSDMGRAIVRTENIVIRSSKKVATATTTLVSSATAVFSKQAALLTTYAASYERAAAKIATAAGLVAAATAGAVGASAADAKPPKASSVTPTVYSVAGAAALAKQATAAKKDVASVVAEVSSPKNVKVPKTGKGILDALLIELIDFDPLEAPTNNPASRYIADVVAGAEVEVQKSASRLNKFGQLITDQLEAGANENTGGSGVSKWVTDIISTAEADLEKETSKRMQSFGELITDELNKQNQPKDFYNIFDGTKEKLAKEQRELFDFLNKESAQQVANLSNQITFVDPLDISKAPKLSKGGGILGLFSNASSGAKKSSGVIKSTFGKVGASITKGLAPILSLGSTIGAIVAPLAIAAGYVLAIAAAFVAVGAAVAYVLKRAGLLEPLFNGVKKVASDVAKFFSDTFGGLAKAISIGEWELAFNLVAAAGKFAFFSIAEFAVQGFRNILKDAPVVLTKIGTTIVNILVDIVSSLPNLLFAALRGQETLNKVLQEIIVGNITGVDDRGTLGKLTDSAKKEFEDAQAAITKAGKVADKERKASKIASEKEAQKESLALSQEERDAKDKLAENNRLEAEYNEGKRRQANIEAGIAEIAVAFDADTLQAANEAATERRVKLQEEVRELLLGAKAYDSEKNAREGVIQSTDTAIQRLEVLKTTLEAGKEIKDRITSLRQETIELEQGAAAGRAASFASKNFNGALNGLIANLNRAEAVKVFTSRMVDLQEQLISAQYGEEQLMRVQLAREGLTKAEIDSIVAMEQRVKALTAQKEADEDLVADAKAIKAALKSPFQVFVEEQKKLVDLQKRGLITQGEAAASYSANIGKLQEATLAFNDVQLQAFQTGSDEAQAARAEANKQIREVLNRRAGSLIAGNVAAGPEAARKGAEKAAQEDARRLQQEQEYRSQSIRLLGNIATQLSKDKKVIKIS